MTHLTTHICDGCGREDVWGSTWTWYGSVLDLDGGAQIVKACSATCMEPARSKYTPRTWTGDPYRMPSKRVVYCDTVTKTNRRRNHDYR